jgi:UDP-glucose 4-epimerase
MRTLVTGGAGFIGSHLVDALMEQDHEVTVLDNLSVGRVAHIDHHLESDRFHFVNGSILDTGTLERLVRQVDAIYHFAALPDLRQNDADPLQAVITNVRGTENVLELAFKYWARVVVASSSAVYGKSTDVPLSEASDRVLGSTEVERWSYGDAKAIGEHFALAYARRGLPVTVLRYFKTYGPRVDAQGYGGLVAQFLTQALRDQTLVVPGDGEQPQCFTYVADVIGPTVRAASAREAAGKVFNVGSNYETTLNELAEMVLELTGSESVTTHAFDESTSQSAPREICQMPDVTQARDVLGFEPRTPLREGLRQTLAWFRGGDRF